MPLSLHRSRDRKYRRGFRGVGWFGLTSVLGCLMALPALATSGTQKAGDPQRPPAGPTISQAGSNALPELRARFATAWAAFRAGDEATRPELLACAKALADAGRADALTIAHFFVNLSPAQRRLGWEQEQAVYRLRERVQAAHEEHAASLRTEGRPAPTDWPQERSAIQASLQALIAAVPEPGDPTPRAHAYALLARLDLARLDQGKRLRDQPGRSVHSRPARRTRAGTSPKRLRRLRPRGAANAATGAPLDSGRVRSPGWAAPAGSRALPSPRRPGGTHPTTALSVPRPARTSRPSQGSRRPQRRANRVATMGPIRSSRNVLAPRPRPGDGPAARRPRRGRTRSPLALPTRSRGRSPSLAGHAGGRATAPRAPTRCSPGPRTPAGDRAP